MAMRQAKANSVADRDELLRLRAQLHKAHCTATALPSSEHLPAPDAQYGSGSPIAGSNPIRSLGRTDGALQAAALAKSLPMRPSVKQARDLVDALRNEKLVHQIVPDEMRGAVQVLSATLNQAIELLAKDIYSNDARFLSELLQNAE